MFSEYWDENLKSLLKNEWDLNFGLSALKLNLSQCIN